MTVVSLVLLSSVSCVPRVHIEGAPCPCPDGFVCCETLDGCIDDGASCPDSYPPSTAAPCARNRDCPRGEVCQAWSGADGRAAGPRSCRRDCSSGLPCAAVEVCELALQDGAPVADVNAVRMCTEGTPMFGCGDPGCQGCDPEQLGQTFCESAEIHACFVGVHPRCGLICSEVVVQVCGDAGCLDSGGFVCNAPPNGDPCVDFPCSACPDPSTPGEYACDGTDRVVGCVVAKFDGDSCDSICALDSWECEAPARCHAEDGARCEP